LHFQTKQDPVMKNLAKPIATVLLSLMAVAGFSQNAASTNAVSATTPKTTLFAAYPASISCKETELNDVFKSAAGQNISVVLSGTPMFSGVVVANIVRHTNLQSIAVKLPALNNAVLTLSKRIDEKNNTVYIGHIINTKNSDAYELKHMADGSYQFVKVDLDKLLPACTAK
jgi:hypothetical protein